MTRPIGPRKIPPVRGGVAQLGERRVRNAEVVSSILILSTRTPKPGHAPGFFMPAKAQQWRGFAGGANFDDRQQALISPCQPPEFLSFLCFCLAWSMLDTL